MQQTNKLILAIVLLISPGLAYCTDKAVPDEKSRLSESKNIDKVSHEAIPIESGQKYSGKPIIYQVFTRIFGNRKSANQPWGDINTNGVGKFNDFTDQALLAIKEFGTSHIWFTGVPHHAVIGDYSQIGIVSDDPDVVKGRAGSPYAVKDYYNVNPDLAVDPANRLAEFKALIKRTHRHKMKVIIDIVPNHVARNYHSISKPEGVNDFGDNDDKKVAYQRDNNFYYIPGKSFKVPYSETGYQPLGGEKHPLADGVFIEQPVKWTGNGSRKAQPDINDWYETVKINYGVRPEGGYDFVRLPSSFNDKDYQQHFAFWQQQSIPDSWKKFRDIALYWIDMGVDGFRYDMAEMVPVEFWSYLNSAIKMRNPDATLVAEVYNPDLFKDYIYLGKMDYLYDKVDFYDTIKLMMLEQIESSRLLTVIEKNQDIENYLLHFMENHDELRIASQAFAGDANRGKPAMAVSALVGNSANMLYYAQALGEASDLDAGFGDPGRTSIFDYWGLPTLQRWSNGGKYDGELLTQKEKELLHFYTRILSLSTNNPAFNGNYQDLHRFNLQQTEGYDESLFSFARWSADQKLVVVSNFSQKKSYQLEFNIPEKLASSWNLTDGDYQIEELISQQKQTTKIKIKNNQGKIKLQLKPLETKVLRVY